MRLFYGIQLSDDIRELLLETILHFQSYIPAGVKWVEPENLHVTYQFVGQVKPTQMADLEESFLTSISSCSEQKFKINALELFPLKEPKLIWVKLDSENKQFSKATKSLRNFLKQQGFNLDNKDFFPHITLGRIKTNLMKAQIEFILQTKLEKCEIDVKEITLFESNLTQKGAHYRVLQTYNLI